MHFVEKEAYQKRIDFNEKLKSNQILRVPGAYNPLTAKLIEEIGYDAVYVSGGVMANDLGFPDIGLTTLQDVSTRSYLISRVTNLPTIVDIDTGFKSCKETIETFEEFGITAVHLEDQIERKRCGHLDNKELEQFGYNIVIYPVTTQRLAMKNVEDGLRDIYANGHQNNIIDKMQTRKRLYELVDYEKYNSLDEKIFNFSTEGHE